MIAATLRSREDSGFESVSPLECLGETRMKRIVYSWCAVIVLVAATADARADAIDHSVNERMRELRLPGVALAVVRGGEIVTIRCFGSADLEHAVPVSEDSVFEIGSLTKQFTAVALMMLVEEGKVALDDSVTKHLTCLSTAARREG